MRKKIFLFAGIVLLCFIAWGFYLFNKPHTGVENIQPAVTIAATDLYAQYSTAEKHSDSIFLDKIIEVKGIVSDVQKTDTAMNILLKAGETGDINCSLSLNDNKNIPMPSVGQNILLKGKCTGFLMDVELVDCIIEK